MKHKKMLIQGFDRTQRTCRIMEPEKCKMNKKETTLGFCPCREGFGLNYCYKMTLGFRVFVDSVTLQYMLKSWSW